jgi:hypothetical protein
MTPSVTAASSFHVKGVYTWPHINLTVNVGLLESGAMAGKLDDQGEQMTALDVAGHDVRQADAGLPGVLRQVR